MKTIKFFSFAMLLSLSWVACKDAATTTTENSAATAETLSAETLATNKTSTQENLSNMQTVLTAKIAEIEASLATAKDANKSALTAQLDGLKKMQTDLQSLTTKVNESTIENWSTVANEVESLHVSIKTVLSNIAPGSEATTAGQLAK